MRYIATNNLPLDKDWLKAAEAATVEVRGASPEKRSAVISKHQTIWKDLKEKLRELSHGKCWYCESIDDRSDNAVDHYRPKNNVKDAAPPHDGYWWLAFSWKNYRFSCTFCNSVRTSASTSGGKHDYFPLWEENRRARSETDSLDEEMPLLLDPTNPLDVELISFSDDGSVGPAQPDSEKQEHAAAVETIRRYHLNHPYLVERRAELLRTMRISVEEADRLLTLHVKDNFGQSRVTAKNRIQDILQTASPRAVYSTAVKHLLAAMEDRSMAAKSVLKLL